MKIRSFLTIVFIYAYSWLLMQIERSTFADPEMLLYLWIVGSFIAVSLIWAIWNLEIGVRQRQLAPKNESSIEKKKRERIDSVLRDLSDDDLLRLRRRLLDGTIDDSHLEDALVGEDGELLYKEQ